MSAGPEASFLAVEAWEDGAAFLVKAHAGAGRDAVTGVHDRMVKVDVSAAPEKGKANQAIVRLLAKVLKTPPRAMVLLAGETNPKKRFGVRGVAPAEAAARLRAACAART